MTSDDRRTTLVKYMRDPMWQMIGVVVTVLIAVVTAWAGLSGDDGGSEAPAVTTPVTAPPAIEADIDGSCNGVGNGNSVDC